MSEYRGHNKALSSVEVTATFLKIILQVRCMFKGTVDKQALREGVDYEQQL